MANTRNKGEWAEPYVFFKILREGSIPWGKGNLETLVDRVPVSVKKVMLPNSDGSVLLKGNGNIEVVGKDGAARKSCMIDDIVTEQQLSDFKKVISEGKRAFAIPDFDDLTDRLGITLPKSKGLKTDIVLDIECDGRLWSEKGFSIKSDWASPPSLLNASPLTRFIFEVVNLTDDHMGEVNKIENPKKYKKRVNYIYKNEGDLIFQRIVPKEPRVSNFNGLDHNLRQIDSQLPELLSRMLLEKFSGEENDPIKKNLKGVYDKDFIESHKNDLTTSQENLKDLLFACLLGMNPETKWEGEYAAHGLVVVTSDGDLRAYHRSWEREHLRDYLWEHARFDTPSTKNCGIFGEVYPDADGTNCLKLGLNVRLK